MWQWGEAVRCLRVRTEYYGYHTIAKVKSSTLEVLSFDFIKYLSAYTHMLHVSDMYFVHNLVDC